MTISFAEVHTALTGDGYDRLFRRNAWAPGLVMASTPPDDLMAARKLAPFSMSPQAGDMPYLTLFDAGLQRHADWAPSGEDRSADDWIEVCLVPGDGDSPPALEPG